MQQPSGPVNDNATIIENESRNIFVTLPDDADQLAVFLRNRTNRELEGVRQNLLPFMNAVKSDESIKTYDLRSEDVYHIDIGVIEPELELDLFNAIRVSPEIPFVVLNRDRIKDPDYKGRYISEDRNFKICHSVDAAYEHESFLGDWKNDIPLNLPYTLIMKVLIASDTNKKVKDGSYVNVVYEFDVGAAIHLRSGQNRTHAQKAIEILTNHISGFTITLGGIKEISGSFVLDHVVFDRYALRWVLMNNHQLPGTTVPLMFWPYLWINERDHSMTARSHLILNFKFGNVKSKIVISSKQAEARDLFYQKGVPVRFKERQPYNLISISEVATREQAYFIKDVLTTVAALYAVNNTAAIAQYQIGAFVPQAVTKGVVAVIPPEESYEVTSTWLNLNPRGGKSSRNFINKQLDPTFYGAIPTTKYISSNKRPAQIKVTTRDPRWRELLLEIMSNRPDVQVIRYPLNIIGSEQFAESSRTIVPPYFLFADLSDIKNPSIYLRPRVNPEPNGSENTYHPYLFTCINSQFLELPGGNDLMMRYNALVDLNTPYTVRYLKQSGPKESSHIKKTMKILRPGETGFIPGKLELVLSSFIVGGQYVDGTGITRTISGTPNFKRLGSIVSTASIIHVLITKTQMQLDLKDRYLAMGPIERENFVQTVVRKKIVDESNWNLARQELYDWEIDDMKKYFLDPKNFVDTYLFRAILSKFFGVFLLIIQYDRDESKVEIPRHKFCYINPVIPSNSLALVFFKHSGAKSFTSPNPQYEIVELLVNESGHLMSRDWDLTKINNLFGLQNRTVDVRFTTINLKKENIFKTGSIIETDAERKGNLLQMFKRENLDYQFVDGAGKLRAFVHSMGGKRLTIACEPLAPLDLDCFDDLKALVSRNETKPPEEFLAAQNFDDAIGFVRSLKVPVGDISYNMEFESLVAVEEESVVAEAPVVKETDAARRERIEKELRAKGMSMEERLAASRMTTVPGFIDPSFLEVKAETPLTQSIMKKLPPRKVIRKVNENPKAIGIWFKVPGHNIKFYIATTPGTPLTPEYAVDNEPYFTVEPENLFFRQHDEMERIANVLVQLARNLYIYSRVDDVDFFMRMMTVIDGSVVYDLTNARRQIPSDRLLSSAPTSPGIRYPAFFPTFFKRIEGETRSRLVFDSDLTSRRIRQHLKIVQKLKENIVGASGSKMKQVFDGNGVRQVQYVPFIGNALQPARYGIDDEMIEHIPRLDKFYNRPLYIIEFYAYASDFARRGPDQNILMSHGEFTEYLNLTKMEKKTEIKTYPLPPNIKDVKSPVHYSSADGSLYIIQNVEGGALGRVNSVIVTWARERVNLGYFAEESLDKQIRIISISSTKLDTLDPSQYFMVLDYGGGHYGALLKLEGAI